MWKLLNKLFGWDYVAYKFGYNVKPYRVRRAPNGKYYIKVYGNMFFFGDGYISYPVSGGIVYKERYTKLTKSNLQECKV